MPELSVLCVTQNEPHARRFLDDMANLAERLSAELVIGLDRCTARDLRADKFVNLSSGGYIESVLDEAIAACSGEWILRLDDDEAVSLALAEWLWRREYVGGDIFAFRRMHLWGDEEHFITNDPLWPDVQTRLAKKGKSGGRHSIHIGSPYGTGKIIAAPIMHHKFLVRSPEERQVIADRYEQIQPGGGLGYFNVFSMPEEALSEIVLAEVQQAVPV